MTHGWEPRSPCGAGCLPSAGSVPAVGAVRRAARLVAVVVVLAALGCVLVSLPWRPARSGERALRRWFRIALAALGVRAQVSGGDRFGPREVGALVVANHESWLDVLALGAVQPLRMVCRSDVRGWPVVGVLAARAGTLFLDRHRLRPLPGTVAAITGLLRGGASVGVFPEGTTYCGTTTGEFRPAAFQAALDAGALVCPVAVRYRVADVPTTAAAFVGDAVLWRSVTAVAAVRGLVVEIRVLPVLDAADPRWAATDRRALAAAADAAVRGLPAPAPGEPVRCAA